MIGSPIALHLSASNNSSTDVAPAIVKPAVHPAKPTPDARAQMLAWITANLAPDAVIVADSTSAAQLRAAGFVGSTAFDQLGNTPLPTVDYVLSIPSADTSTVTGPAGWPALTSNSLPLASFGTASVPATIREYFPTGLMAITQQRATDDVLRRQGGSELVDNPALVFDAAGRARVAAGDLDLRAQNVLNLLASQGTTYVTVGASIAAEAGVGQPIRTVMVTTADAAGTQTLLASMLAPFKPTGIVAISDRKFRLTWGPAIAPVPTVGQ